MNVAHIATICAFETKDGGFRGVYKAVGQERVPSPELFDTLAEATFWAKNEAHKRHAGNYSLAPMRRRGEYLANVWARV